MLPSPNLEKMISFNWHVTLSPHPAVLIFIFANLDNFLVI